MSDHLPAPHFIPDIEHVASLAIALSVRVVEQGEGTVTLAAPHDVTPHGEQAIVAAVRRAFPSLAVFVTLDPKPAEP